MSWTRRRWALQYLAETGVGSLIRKAGHAEDAVAQRNRENADAW